MGRADGPSVCAGNQVGFAHLASAGFEPRLRVWRLQRTEVAAPRAGLRYPLTRTLW